MDALVSVIVPIYKVEDCLARCLDSICRQSLFHIEIILVDDGSPDRCGEICEEYAEKDPRIKVIHHNENLGLSAARNSGIRIGKANYLMFVDSDDYVHEDFCKAAYDCAVQHDADLVMFRFQSIGRDGNLQKRKPAAEEKPGLKTRLEATDLLFNGIVGLAAWNKLYRKELFHTVLYPAGRYYEDVGTTHQLVWQARRICYLDKVLYVHCYHPGSITTLKTEKALQDWIAMHIQQYEDLAAWGYPKEKLKLNRLNFAMSLYIKFGKSATGASHSGFMEGLLQCNSIPPEFTWKRKVLFVLLKYCPPLFESVCTLWGKRN